MGVITIPILGCFTFLVAMTVSPARCTIYEETIGQNFVNMETDLDASINNDNRDKRSDEKPVYRSGLLVGEDTHVYIAHRPDPDLPVNFTMLKIGIVKEAIDEWKTREPTGWNNMNTAWYSRSHRSVKQNRPPVEIDDEEGVQTRNISEEVNSLDNDALSRSKRRVNLNVPIVDIPIFVVMDYPSDWPANRKDEPKYIKEQILYAIAFWNSVNFRYRNIVEPSLRIRIAGIVINRNKEAAPYLRKHETKGRLDVNAALTSIINYFGGKTLGHSDFHDNPLHYKPIIGVMTKSRPPGGALDWFKPEHHLSEKPKEFSFLFCDDHGFGSLRSFIIPSSTTDDLLAVMDSDFQRQKKHVDKFTGEPIKVVPMPGQVMSPNKQCEHRGWAPDSKVCYYYNPCTSLNCKTNFLISVCGRTGPAVDGTFCNDGHVCLAGSCVSDKYLIY